MTQCHPPGSAGDRDPQPPPQRAQKGSNKPGTSTRRVKAAVAGLIRTHVPEAGQQPGAGHGLCSPGRAAAKAGRGEAGAVMTRPGEALSSQLLAAPSQSDGPAGVSPPANLKWGSAGVRAQTLPPSSTPCPQHG